MTLAFVNYSFAGAAKHFDVPGKRLLGGGEVYLRDLCKLLQRKGFQPSVLQGGEVAEEFEVDGIPVRQIASRGRYWFNLEWPGSLKNFDGKVHLHDANHAFPLARGNTATFHGVSWDLPYYGGGLLAYADWAARRAFFKLLIRHAVLHCKSIVSVDSCLLRYVQSEFPNQREKITVIPNYVDLKAFKQAFRKKKTE